MITRKQRTIAYAEAVAAHAAAKEAAIVAGAKYSSMCASYARSTFATISQHIAASKVLPLLMQLLSNYEAARDHELATWDRACALSAPAHLISVDVYNNTCTAS